MKWITDNSATVEWGQVPGATGYKLYVSTDNGATISQTWSTSEPNRAINLSDLTATTNYWVQLVPLMGLVEMQNLISPWIEFTTADVDIYPPRALGAFVGNTQPSNVIIYFSENLSAASLALSKFDVTVNGVSVNKNSADAANNGNDKWVVVVLAAPVVNGDVIAVAYTEGVSGSRIHDAAGNFTEDFTLIARNSVL